MAKKSSYICQTCGYVSTGWLGKCPECDTWGSLIETVVQTGKSKGSKNAKAAKSVLLSDVTTNSEKRISTKISEFDRVLGGGLVAGQVILLAGEPGVGKSTILTQLTEKLAKMVYVSGEESARQVALRATRLGIKPKKTEIYTETDIDVLLDSLYAAEKPDGVIIDSIQTIHTSDLSGMAGSAGQIRECSHRLVRFAKDTGVPVIIVGHITKQGSVAGPALLMHIVDTVLWFEGAKDQQFRMLRARKNRFGPTDEVGIFTMEETGLESVSDTSHLFVSEMKKNVSGSCRAVLMEGTRPIIVEVQSLLVRSKLAFPKRVSQGVDGKRLELLLAVLERRAGLNMSNYDVFVNVAGGLKVKETGIDMAICLSLASSYFDKMIPSSFVTCGEIGLLGEIRSVSAQAKRAKEAKRLGYKKILTSDTVSYIREAVDKTFPSDKK